MGWRPIKEELVLHRWQCFCDDESESYISEVPPYWYAENGTPTCICGEDMEYIETLLDCKFDPIRETLVISVRKEKNELITQSNSCLEKQILSDIKYDNIKA